MQKNTSN